jgi:RND superfamily putative drug exporter
MGIDYAMFVVAPVRCRAHIERDRGDAVVTPMAVSGRAVVFAGCTVVLSLLGLFLPRLTFIGGAPVARTSRQATT